MKRRVLRSIPKSSRLCVCCLKMPGFLMLLATAIMRNPHNYYEADFCHEGLIFGAQAQEVFVFHYEASA